MTVSKLRILVVAASLAFLPQVARAQALPTADQAQQMLQNNPALLQQLKARILGTGMTPDQVRAKLRAEGYPENLLDAYLTGGTGGADTTAASAQVLSAIGQLGLADTTDVALLQCGINPDTIVATPVAGMPSDSASLARQQLALRQAARTHCIAQSDSSRLLAAADSGFVIFGLDFFRNYSSQFDPNLGGPVDPNYRIGPGDQLVLVLTGDVEASYTLDVTRDGFVVIPTVGQIWVNGLTMAELNDVLYAKLGRVYSGVRRGAGATTHFSVTPSRLRSNQIYVVGEVTQPGSYRISSAGTAMTALYAALGPTENGTLRQIRIMRGSGAVDILDVYDYLLKGDASHDVRLENGDRVFVPIHGPRVRIVGEVSRPATYELRAGETLSDVLRFAGGFKATAARGRVQIERILPPSERGTGGRDRVVMDISSDSFLTGTGPSIPLQPDDIIRVFPVTTRIRNRILVDGDVWAPGTVGITSGMKVSDALRLAGGVKSDVYLGEILISRLQPDSTRIQLHASLRDTTGVVNNDFPVKEDDEIHVYATTEFRTQRYVQISGAVKLPVTVPFREGMTVRDLVLQAGGLQESALLNEAEIARLPADRTRGATATTFRIPLDSSYVFERGPDGKYLGPPGLPAPQGPSPEVVLQPYDNVLILRQPNWELQRTAVITGEVRYPGAYSLTTKTERVSDLIKRAGGLTSDGYANGVVFYRNAGGVGRIGIELPQVLRNPESRDNLPLQDGDSIFIPRYNAVVNVQGEVNSPVAVTYSPGKKLDYYIRAAGGPGVKADLGRAYVTQPNGKVDARASRFLLPDHVPEPSPGSTVYVPARDPGAAPFNFLQSAGSIAQVLATLVTVIIALRR